MERNVIIKSWRQPQKRLNRYQKSIVNEINYMIDKGNLNLTECHCMCGNAHEKEDTILTEKDSWGIKVGQVLCSKCGLIRNRTVFSSESYNVFYEEYYRKLYNSNKIDDASYFNMQCRRGSEFYSLLEKLSIINDIIDIAEFGCGAGGVLLPFAEKGKNVIGIDLDNDFLEQGRLSGLNLVCGDFYSEIADTSCDLIIMSHVLEHLTDPIAEIIRLREMIKNNKYLLVQVPGLFSTPKPNYPLSGFQIAHVYYFYKEWLEEFFYKLGFDILYSDDKCSFVLRKNQKTPQLSYVWNDNLSLFQNKILKRCCESQLSAMAFLRDKFKGYLFFKFEGKLRKYASYFF